MPKIRINRAPVLTLWSFVVAQRLGHSRDTALTLAKAVAGVSAYAKAKSLGLAEDRDASPAARKKSREKGQKAISFMGRRIPVVPSPSGPLALAGGKPIQPKSVEKYLASKFAENYDTVHAAMVKLAKSRTPTKLAVEAFHLYEGLRPTIPAGVAGWGKAGVLDLAKIDRMAE
jgi:hypothetical protein